MGVVIKPIAGYSDHIAMARSYGVLRPGVGTMHVCLRNHSAKQIILPKQTAVGDCSGKCHSVSVGTKANRG